jgi:hypothetical protein
MRIIFTVPNYSISKKNTLSSKQTARNPAYNGLI